LVVLGELSATLRVYHGAGSIVATLAGVAESFGVGGELAIK